MVDLFGEKPAEGILRACKMKMVGENSCYYIQYDSFIR